MNMLRVLCLEKGEFVNALGEDRVLLVQGRRDIYQDRQKRGKTSFLSEIQQDVNQLEKICECAQIIPIGGHKHKHKGENEGRKESRNISVQTLFPTEDSTQTNFPLTSPYKNRGTQTQIRVDPRLDEFGQSLYKLKVLDTTPRDILEGLEIREPVGGPQSSLVHSEAQTKKIPLHQAQQKAKAKLSSSKRPKCKFNRFTKAIKGFFAAELLPEKAEEEVESDFHVYLDEKNGEWLEYTASEANTEAEGESLESTLRDQNFPIEPHSYQLHKELRQLLYRMALLGKYPFTNAIEDRLIQFTMKKCSSASTLFFITSIITAILALGSISNFMYIFAIRDDRGLPFAEYAEFIEVEKYWTLVFYHLILAFYVTFWCGIMLYHDGHGISYFMSKMSRAVSAMRYQPFAEIKGKIWTTYTYLILYALVLVGLFISDGIPAVRGACGLFGSMLVRSVLPGLRTTQYHFWISILGLLVHLYIVTCEKLITTFLTVNCKLVENLAHIWNLRMAHSLGLVEQFDRNTSSSTTKYMSKIPFNKLLAEHTIITSFVKLTGKVFKWSINSYLFMKFLETSLFGYRFLTYLTVHAESKSRYAQTYVEGRYEESVAKVKYEDSFPLTCVYTFVLLIISVIGWIWTSSELTGPGKAIFGGHKFLRRFGFLWCKSSKQKRFLLSLNLEQGMAEDNVHLRPGYLFNRKFISSTALWQFLFILGLLAFNPFKVSQVPVDLCEPNPSTGQIECLRVFQPPSPGGVQTEENARTESQVVDKEIDKTPIPAPPPNVGEKPEGPTITTITAKKPYCGGYNETCLQGNLTCLNDIKKKSWKLEGGHNEGNQEPQYCAYIAKWGKKDFNFYLPIPCIDNYTVPQVVKPFVPIDEDGIYTDQYYFKQVQSLKPKTNSELPASCFGTYTTRYSSKTYGNLDRFDDCGNPNIKKAPTPEKEPKKRAAILFSQINGKYIPEIFCCYDYETDVPAGFDSSYKFCSSSEKLVFNQINRNDLKKCQSTSKGNGIIEGHHLANIHGRAEEFGILNELVIQENSFNLVPIGQVPKNCKNHAEIGAGDVDSAYAKMYGGKYKEYYAHKFKQEDLDDCYCS